MSELDQLFDEINLADQSSENKLRWNPDHIGEIDIRISADGNWHHQGRQFQRKRLVKLFASVLRREAEGYFLVTPAEKLRIQVDDAPFVAVLVEQIEEQGQSALVFTTNIGERFTLDKSHPLRIQHDPENGEPRPYLSLRNGLEALISRSAFFDLTTLAVESEKDGIHYYHVTSLGDRFELGNSAEL